MAEKKKVSDLPESIDLTDFYAFGYKVGQSVKVAIETLKGNKGETGLIGPQGEKGDKGDQGEQGPQYQQS